MLLSVGTSTREPKVSAYAPLPSEEIAPSLALVFLAAFTLQGPSTISPASLIPPVHPSDASRAPWERLHQLNADYDPAKERFGTGNARLDLYRNEMLAAIRDTFGNTSTTSVPMLYGDDEELLEDMLCHLDLGCSSFKPIPQRVFSHGSGDTGLVHLRKWQQLNPDLFELQLSDHEDLRTWAGRRFDSSSIPDVCDRLPSPAHQDNLSRFLALLTTGGIFTSPTTLPLQPIADWARTAVDITDPVLAPERDPLSSPSLIVGIAWTGHTAKNALNPLFSREAGLAVSTFGATPGHPMQSQGSGLTSDSVRLLLTPVARRYLRTRWATSLALISREPVPVRIGDALILPMGSLHARSTHFAKLLDWSVGRDFSPLSIEKDFVAREG
ncbi:mannan polymerase II complex HOC1 subunit, glycosyltransferase family 32 protein [Rhodotorula toruloides]|uniref:Mannan polymerase II complex HOC1 subunit, glycosyltransferase family 32 protein n=1 Tax=Rhodotorula toruloides TaxID=5286 RepID=A0A511KLB7_RHOTO|nr:mannan polymerase II complex HOC1 subunit, glycosyltransferase family 32 protein [Rhodotorula toruloides]